MTATRWAHPRCAGSTLGLDTSAYTVGYVATWTANDAEAVRTSAANVLRAAHTLADALTETAETAA